MGKICTMLAILAMMSVATFGAIIAEENFDYADGALAGNNGGSGWTGAWTDYDGTAPTVVGGVAQLSFSGAGWQSSQADRYLNAPLTSAWIRATVQKTVTAGNGASFGCIGLFEGGAERGLIGNFWPGVAVDAWGAGPNGSQGEIAGKLVTTLSDVIVYIDATETKLWVNPVDPRNPGTPDAVGGGIGQFDRIILRCGTNDNSETWQVDNLVIAETLDDVTGGIMNLNPTSGQPNVDPAVVLEWTGPEDPNIASIVNYTIYLDPNETHVTDMASAEMDYFDDAIAGTQTTYDPVPDLEYDTEYFWRVVATVQYDYKTVGDTNDITSNVWAFTTKELDTPPVVDAGGNIMVTTEMASSPFALEGTVTDDGTSAMTVGWEAFEVALGGGSATTKVSFVDAADPNTTVTVSEAGSYIVKLTATDATGSVSDQKEITVVEDGCRAAQMFAGYQANYYDRNGDCVVNLEDFAEFALQWLNSTALSDAIFYNGFLPQDIPATGNGLVAEMWLNIEGTDVNDLVTSDLYPNNSDFAYFVTEEFRAISNTMNNYGQRIRGYIVPSASADYTFYIASDDQSQLLLSTDADSANATLIAEVPDPDGTETGWTGVDVWDKYPEQTSATISLTAGQYYYVEVLHKEGTGNEHVSVGWSPDGGTTIEVIPATELRYIAP